MLKIQLFCKRISVVGEIMSRINAKLGLGGKSPAEIALKKVLWRCRIHVRLYRRLLVLGIVYMMLIFELASLIARRAKFMSQVAFSGVLMQEGE